ncbi:MAG: hypothetical protein JF587_20130 [Catenulisporales bacterium]|nr:hypothetical protein [Catenulisporales bacterium]
MSPTASRIRRIRALIPPLTAGLVAGLAGGCGSDGSSARTDRPLPGLAPDTVGRSLADAGWAVPLAPMPRKGAAPDPKDTTWLRQGRGRAPDGVGLGVVTGGTTGTTVSTVTCQVFGATPARAVELLAGCAKATAAGQADDARVRAWLKEHVDQASQGIGFPLTSRTVTYHLGVMPGDDIRALTTTAN